MDIRAILRSMRMHQWVKNLVLFAALIFSRNLGETDLLLRTLAGFIAFCLLSSSVYLINDVKDRESDRLHPVKRYRPIASGRLSVSTAFLAVAVLLTISAAIALWLGSGFSRTALAYLGLNVLYSFSFRNLVVLDVSCIAVGFVLRAIAGAEILHDAGTPVEISPWLLMCTFLLSLFLGFGKRYHEISSAGAEHRQALNGYTVPFLGKLLTITAAATLLSYSLYTIWPDTVQHFGTTRLLYTIPFVFYGLSRYLYLVTEEAEGGDPSETLVTRRSIVLTVGLWFASVAFILYAR